MSMYEETLLTLHCLACAKIVEVVTEGQNLVCLDCGHKFADSIAAKYMNPAPEASSATAP